MSLITIKYQALEDAAGEAKTLSKDLRSYADDMDSVTKSLSDLPGSDSRGYVSSALSIARKKAQDASDASYKYSNFSEKLKNMSSYAKEKDKNAASGIQMTVESYVGERSLFQKLKDGLYEGYVNFVNRLENSGPLGKLLAEAIRKGVDGIGSISRKVINFFKYGDGKYWLNIFDAVKDALLAVGVLASAIIAFVGGPAWLVVIGVVAIVAGTIYLVQQVTDSIIRLDENFKSLDLSEGGNITAARYYGEIEGVKDKTTHYDYGDSEENNAIEKFGENYDKAKKINKMTAKTLTAFENFFAGGLVVNPDGTKSNNFDFSQAVKNILHKKKGDSGFEAGGYNVDKGWNPIHKIISHKYEDYGVLPKIALDGSKTVDNIEKIFKGVNDLRTGDLSVYDTADKAMDIAGKFPFIDSYLGDIWNTIKNGKTLGDIFFPKKVETVNPFSGLLPTPVMGGR